MRGIGYNIISSGQYQVARIEDSYGKGYPDLEERFPEVSRMECQIQLIMRQRDHENRGNIICR
jgi:hypothetical protein